MNRSPVFFTLCLMGFNAFLSAEQGNTDSSSSQINLEAGIIAKASNMQMKSGNAPSSACETSCRNWGGIEFEGDFIYWQGRMDGMGIAQGNAAPDIVTPIQSGKYYEPRFHYRPGFKVGVGADLTYDNWDVFLGYTWLRSSDNKVSFSSGDRVVISKFSVFAGPFFSTLPAFTSLTQASSKWKLNFNVLDLELGRNFTMTKAFDFRAHVGLKGGWITDRDTVQYLPGGIIFGNGVTAVTMKMKQNWSGVGIRGGLDMMWSFVREWGVYGDIALSGLWSHFNDRRKDVNTTVLDNVYTSFDAKHQFNTLKPVLELGLGLRYHSCFADRKWSVLAQAGWEEQVWFSFNQHLDPMVNPQGDLLLQGLTVKLAFMF